ncbi:MFS transporter [Thermoactinomyces sp. CICC 10735]|uniref:MFS transporter n=1 Tax=Thermoactinomyces sp. CICC 10735 TaxID=2767430 RepID=UPI00351B3E96
MNRSVNIANRLDRLPVSSVHKNVLYALAFAYFFELGDLNTFAYAAPALIKHWDLSISTIAFITSISFLGMFLGSTVGGWFADQFGRKKGLMVTVTFFSLFSLLSAVAWNPFTLGMFRFLTGIGLSAMTVIANTYISEFFPASVRGKYQALCVTIGLCGIPITSWVSRLVIPLGPWGWRMIFVWGALGIFFVLLARKMEESPRWFEKRGRFEEANAAMERIEAAVVREKGSIPVPKAAREAKAIQSVPVSELFHPTYRGRTALLLAVWIFQTLGFYAFGSWVPTLLVKQGFSVENSLTYSAISSLGAPIGALLGSMISDRMERKWALTLLSVVIMIVGLLYGMTFTPIFIMVCGFLVHMFERTFSSILYAYTPEMFPTEARASGSGLTYGVGRLANIVGPIMIGYLYTGYGYTSVFVLIAACWLAVAFSVGIFGPLTRKRSLEDLSQSQIDTHPSVTSGFRDIKQ